MFDPSTMREVALQQHQDRLKRAERNQLVHQMQANHSGPIQQIGVRLRMMIRRRPVQVQAKPTIPAVCER